MKNIHSSEKGQILVLLALVLLGLLGFTALAIDGGMIYADRRYMQSAADAASLAGAGEVGAGVEALNMKTAGWSCSDLINNLVISDGYNAAINKAYSNGFTIERNADLGSEGNINGVKITCYNGTATDPETGETVLLREVDVMVMLTQETNTSFVHLFTQEPMKNTITSITTVEPGVNAGGGYSIVALRTGPCDPNNVGVTVSGNSEIVIQEGGIWSNSCMTYDGGVSVSIDPPDPGSIVYNTTDDPYKLAGGEPPGIIDPDPTATSAHHPVTGGMDVTIECTAESQDPYENIRFHKPGDTMYLEPGNYGDITLTDGTIILTGGLYCIDGNVNINGGTFTIDTSSSPPVGVTFKFTGRDFTINGAAHVVLAAPNEEPVSVTANDPGHPGLEDMLLYVPPGIEADIKLNGNAGSSVSGTIYAPASFIDVGGSTNLANDETFTITSSIIGLDVKVAGTPGIHIRYDEDMDYGTPSSLYVRK